MQVIGMFLALVISVVAILSSLVAKGAQGLARSMKGRQVDYALLAADTWAMGKAHITDLVEQGQMGPAQASRALMHLEQYCTWIEAGNLPR